jgi:hypothetical protein
MLTTVETLHAMQMHRGEQVLFRGGGQWSRVFSFFKVILE